MTLDTLRRLAARISRGSVIALPFAAFFVGGIALLAHFDPLDEWYLMRRVWMILWWFGLLGWWLLALRKADRESWQTRGAERPEP